MSISIDIEPKVCQHEYGGRLLGIARIYLEINENIRDK